jgi:hypothetical protein
MGRMGRLGNLRTDSNASKRSNDFEAGTLTVQANRQSVTVRDDTGRPMWAGRGNW